ncbi:MAG: site-2 protease family protein [Candidatus Bathyarchaeia archaeon]
MSSLDVVIDGFAIFLLFWLMVYYVGKSYKLSSRGIDIKPLVLIFRTKRANKFLELGARKFRRVIPIYSDISIALAVGMMAYGAYALISNIASFFIQQTISPVFPAIPFITIKLESLPYFILSLALIVVLHECAHGITAHHEGIQVKSTGVILVGVIPGAFVEPDESNFNRATRRKRLRVLAVGSSINLISGLLASLILTSILIANPLQPNGVLIEEVKEGSPADLAGLKPENVIKAVDGVVISDLKAFGDYMSRIQAGASILLRVEFADNTVRDLTVTTTSHPEESERAVIGVVVRDNIEVPPLYLALFWFQYWSINIAVVNMLPIRPLDGGSVLQNLIERYLPKKTKQVTNASTAFFVVLLLVNLTLTLTGPGFPMI